MCRAAGFEVSKVRMVWKSPADILHLMAASSRADLFTHGFYLWKLAHALFNTITPSFRGDIFVEGRKPAPVGRAPAGETPAPHFHAAGEPARRPVSAQAD